MLTDENQEPILPFQCRRDLEITVLHYRDEESAVVKDPVRLKYFRLTPEQHLLLVLLNVPRSVEFLRRELQKNFPSIHVEKVEIQRLIQDLHQKGLLASNRNGQGFRLLFRRAEEVRKEVIKSAINPMFIRLPGWDPNAFLGWMVRCFGWVFHPAMIVASLMLVAMCTVFAISHYDDIRRKLPHFHDFFSGENLVYLWITLAVTKLVHEFGHGMSCRKLGGECREMGLIFLVFSPTMFCNTSDSWRFENKWHRMAVGAAGMYFELILASLAVILWWNVPAGALQNMCLNVFFVSTVSTLLFNANPLLKFDGYYILSDFLEIPNMQTKGTQALQSSIAWGCFGIKMPHSPFQPRTNRGMFVAYAVLAAIYRWVVMLGIMGFMYKVLKPYRLEMMGLGLACVSLSAGFLQQGRQWYQIFAAPRKEPLSRKKMLISGVILLAVSSVVFAVPVPWYVEASCFVQPCNGLKVYAKVPGILEEIAARPREPVLAGQVIAQLRNDELIDRVEVLEPQVKAAQRQQEAARAAGNDGGVVIARQRELALQQELNQARDWLRQTQIVAPRAGRLVEPPIMEAGRQERTDRLPKWQGTPLANRNLGAFIESQTHLYTIAPSDEYEVVMLLDQEDAKHLTVGKRVRVKIFGLPDEVVTTTIDDLSERAVNVCPPELCTSFGGALAATPASDGKLMLEFGMIQASAKLNSVSSRVAPGFRGSARIIVSEYSIGGWVWRWIATKIRFRL